VNEPLNLRYDPATLRWDFVRAAGGALICFAPLVLIEVLPVMVYILGLVGAIFTVFGLRTLNRQMTTVELSREGIRTVGPLARQVAWNDLNGMKLAFYSTRRRTENRMDFAASKGWMELTLKGSGTTVSCDSSLDGFDAVVDVAFQAALQRNLHLNETTLANLDAMGFQAQAGSLPDDHL